MANEMKIRGGIPTPTPLDQAENIIKARVWPDSAVKVLLDLLNDIDFTAYNRGFDAGWQEGYDAGSFDASDD